MELGAYYPWLLVGVLVGLGVFGTVRHVFLPPHLRKAPNAKRWKMPPGPAGIPLFGNLLQYRHARRDEVELRNYLLDLGRYGEMTTLHVGSKTWVFLNTRRVVSELIAKRANATNERPDMPVASGLISRDNRFVLHHTPQWTESRRMTHHLLNGSALKQYGEWQELESVQMLAGYLQQPNQWYRHHYRYSVSVMHRIVLGERLLKVTPELDQLRRVTVEFLTSINANWVDFFPELAKLPKWLQPWRKRYTKMGKFHHDSHYTWWTPVKQAIADGTAPSSFVRDVVLNPDTKYSGNDEQAMFLALSTVSAGSDNPRMAMNTFVMAAITFPESLKHARKELDDVCGSHAQRLPCINDMARLPYMSALVKEVLRWRPTLHQVPQHMSTQDIDFEGYLFPAGTEFIVNGIAVSQDYPKAGDFNPERFLDGNESNILHGQWAFGGGRRVCVGYKVAQTELFVAFARLIYCFDFAAAGPVDSVRLRHNTPGEPFPVKVTPRSKQHEELILKEANRCGVLESAEEGF